MPFLAASFTIAKLPIGKYAVRKADLVTHERIITLRQSGLTIELIATLAGCSISQVKRVWAIHQTQKNS
ncbi:helix-turn-helix domain-containing protein [Escherichia coli]